MKRRLIVGGVVTVALLVVAAILLKLWDVPDWVKTNSGPWVAFGALVTFGGVLSGLAFQGWLASIERKSRIKEAAKERTEQAERDRAQWLMENRYTAYSEFLSALYELNQNPKNADSKKRLMDLTTSAAVISHRHTSSMLLVVAVIIADQKIRDNKSRDYPTVAQTIAMQWLSNILSDQSEEDRFRNHLLSMETFRDLMDELGKAVPHSLVETLKENEHLYLIERRGTALEELDGPLRSSHAG